MFLLKKLKKIELRSNDGKRIPSIDSIEIYSHRMNNNLIWKREKFKRINIIRKYKNAEFRLYFKRKNKRR